MSNSAFSMVRAQLIGLVLLAVLPAFGLLLHEGHQRGQWAVRMAQQEAGALVQRVRLEYERAVAGTRELLHTLAHISEHHRRDLSECRALFANLLQSHPYYANLGATRPDGVVFCSAQPVQGVVNASDRAWFKNAVATRAFSFGVYQIGRITRKPVFVSSFPSHDRGGRLQSVVFAALDLNRINQIAGGVKLPPETTVTVLDSRGTILNHHPEPEKWIGKSRADTALARAILAGREDGMIEDAGLDGERRLYTYAPLFKSGQGGRLYVAVGIPQRVVTAGVRNNLIRDVTTLAAVTMLVLAIAWFGGDYFLLRKLRVLTDTARRLTRGERARTGLGGARGEIGLLAHAFDNMTDTIEAREAEARRSNELLEKIFDNAHFCVAYLDRDFNFIRVNKAYADTGRHPPEFFIGKNHFELYPGDEAKAIFRRVVETGEPYTAYARPFEYPDQPERGVTYWDWTLSPVRDGEGRVAALVFSLVEVTERVKAEQRTAYLRLHDELTGLPNRLLLLERLRQVLIESGRHGRHAAVLCLDLDRFKVVNETLGHAAGDVLLKEVTERLKACVRPGDTVARLAGDEFALVLADMATMDDAGMIVQKIMACGAKPFSHAGHEYFINVSLGLALFPLDGRDPELLLKNAELAMHQAKERGGNGWQFYSARMADKVAEKVMLSNELRQALDRGEFVLYYQPQLDIASGRVVGAEALIRWKHPQRGLVSPATFIPLAEETGLIAPLGEWVLRQACDQARAWRAAGLPPLRVAVNVSVQQLRHNNLADLVEQALRDCRLPPEALEIEVTESLLMPGDEAPQAQLREVAALGVRIAIDDFGTGYSGLSYLKRFPIRCIKVDQSFVRGLASDSNDASIVRAIVAMAHGLGIKALSEGVETQDQLAVLRTYDCDLAQGFYFSKPLPAEEFARQLREHGFRRGKDCVN